MKQICTVFLYKLLSGLGTEDTVIKMENIINIMLE